METELLRMLEDVGYKGPLLDTDKFSKALELGAKSTDYTSLVAWFTEQIAMFTDIDEIVHPTHSPDDASSFLLELSCFLKEMGCMNQNLTTGNINQRLADKGHRTLLLEILASELMACKLLQVKNPEVNKTLELTINESDTAKHLKSMLIALNFQKPPDNITPQMLFSRIESKLKEIISKVPSELIGKPLFYGELSTSQWEKLDELDKDLHAEYEVRREMLLTRLDVTIRSFLWSDRIKSQENEINTRYHMGRGKLGTKPNVGVADLLAARDDLAIIEKTSSASVRKNTQSSVNKVMIGAVPDRGGRPHEQEPPPPEMPPWQKDRVAGPSSSRGGGRGGGSSAGRGSYGGGYSRGGRGGGGGGEGYGTSGGGGGGYNTSGGYGAGYGGYGGYGGSNYDNRSTYNSGNNYGGGQSYSGGGYGGSYNIGNYGQGQDHQHGRGGRVQGGWSQGGNQRGGYIRGRGWGERQY